MFILDVIAYLSKVRPFTFKASSPSLGIFLEASFTNFRIICEIALYIRYLLVTDIFFFDIAKDVVMKLGIEAEKHFRVVEIATFSHLFGHGFKQTLIHANFVHFQLEMGKNLQNESKLYFKGFQHFGTTVL